MSKYTLYLLIIMISSSSCKQEANEVAGDWIKGDEKERIMMIEDQFSGIHKTMMEMQYRFQELYWAGQDENWQYVEHQVEEMEEALELGLIRRPERAASGKIFQENSFPLIKKAIETKDRDRFLKDFEIFKGGCNNCHVMEEMPFIHVVTPEVKTSSIRFQK